MAVRCRTGWRHVGIPSPGHLRSVPIRSVDQPSGIEMLRDWNSNETLLGAVTHRVPTRFRRTERHLGFALHIFTDGMAVPLPERVDGRPQGTRDCRYGARIAAMAILST